MNINEDPHFRFTELPSAITDRAIVLIGDDGHTLRAIGSGVLVAPELALTAKHVMWDFWTAFQSPIIPRGQDPISTSFRVLAMNFPGEDDNAAFGIVENMWGASFSDLAILHVRPISPVKSKYETAKLILDALPPEPGQNIAAFGYPASSAEALSRDPLEIRWRISPCTTYGTVLQVFQSRRDRSLLNFPSFEINARFEGGMSGGPVFNEAGHLCGIVSASLKPETGVSHIAYAASLWPVFGTNIDFAGPGLIVKGSYPFFELRDVNYISERGWDEVVPRIRIELDENGEKYLALR